MKIKRTFAPTMREALDIVKLEQGDDAVILGNNKVAGGVEIISAIDYDQAQINAELAAQQKKQIQLQSSRYDETTDKTLDKTVDKAPKPASSASTFPLAKAVLSKSRPKNTEDSTEVRQEPVFGDLIQDDVKRTNAPVNASVSTSSSTKPTFDWQSNTPQTNRSNSADFNAKAHAEGLLDSIKVLQTQLSETQAQSVGTDSDNEMDSDKMNDLDDELASLDEQPTQQDSHTSVLPAIDEMKQEMRNMRELMQNQLTALEWDKYKKRNPIRSVLLNLLTELGIAADVCERVMNLLDVDGDDPQASWRQTMAVVTKLMPANNSTIMENGGVVALVGSTGVGKTTTIAKIAARFAHIHGKRSVALISTDNFRIGAQEQLQQYAKLLQIPLLTANSSEELSDRLGMLTDKKLVLIDTAGVSQNDMRLSEQFHNLQQGSPEIQPLLVLSANTQLAALNQTIKNFEKVRLAGSIVTKLDEAASLGGVITAAIRHHLPINFCGLGQQVPEDLEVTKNHRLVSKAVTLMQQYKETPSAETMAMRFSKIVSFGQ